MAQAHTLTYISIKLKQAGAPAPATTHPGMIPHAPARNRGTVPHASVSEVSTGRLDRERLQQKQMLLSTLGLSDCAQGMMAVPPDHNGRNSNTSILAENHCGTHVS